MSRKLIAAVLLSIGSTLSVAQTLTDVRVSLNAPFDGSNAAFFFADERGYYAAEGVRVNMDTSGGSGEVATRIGGGAYDFGFGDVNVLAVIELADAFVPGMRAQMGPRAHRGVVRRGSAYSNLGRIEHLAQRAGRVVQDACE